MNTSSSIFQPERDREARRLAKCKGSSKLVNCEPFAVVTCPDCGRQVKSRFSLGTFEGRTNPYSRIPRHNAP
jgi:hypothetical protein